jgi:hypothetical protein
MKTVGLLMSAGGPDVALGFAARRYPLNTHICFLFNGEMSRDAVLMPYVSSGIAQHQYIEFFPDVDEDSELDPRVRRLNLGEEHTSLGAFPASRKYCPEGTFSSAGMLQRLQQIYDASRAGGYAGGRIFAEMTWALRGFPGTEELVEYEASINDLLVAAPMTVVCAYDTSRFGGDLLADVAAAHPTILSAGSLISNGHCLTVEEYRRSRRVTS